MIINKLRNAFIQNRRVPVSRVQAAALILLTIFSSFANASTGTANTSLLTADLRVAVTATESSVEVGGNVTFTITVCNDGPDLALQPPISRAFLPNGTRVSATGFEKIDCATGTRSPVTNSIIDPGFGVIYTETVRADAVGTLGYRIFLNPAIVPDPNPANNEMTVSITVTERAPATPGTRVFQAAGPNAASIQSTVDQFRAALGGANNGNTPGPIAEGRREIDWDGGGSTNIVESATPFDGFLNNRGTRFTTNGIGFIQAPVSGLATAFGNPQYASSFAAFSPARLFSPLDGDSTRVQFFLPGSNGSIAARTRAFGAVFTDVDTPNGRDRGNGRRNDGTTIEYLDKWGRVLYRGVVPASPGNATLSFFGIVLEDADIASVRILAADKPGPDDDRRNDIVMMDDFIYSEPQPLYY